MSNIPLRTILIQDTLLYNSSKNKLSKSKTFQLCETNLKKTLDTLKLIEKSKSLEDIIEAERILLSNELLNLVLSKEQRVSLESALKDFDESQASLKKVYSKEIYKEIDSSYSSKSRDSAGLAKDAFRLFLDSQKTRFRNKLTNPISEFEVKVFEQRKRNLLTAEELYKDLQREALGITKKQGLSK